MLDVQPLVVDPQFDTGGRVLRETPVYAEIRAIPARLRLELIDSVLASQNLCVAVFALA